MSELFVTKVKSNQIKELQAISRSTFYETFAEFNSENDMSNYLENDMSIQQLTIEFDNPDALFYFVLLNQKFVGYLKLNTINLEGADTSLKGIEIARIYVAKEFHGSGAGQLLYETSVSIAKEHLCHYIWLGVWENNPRAIRFYEKNGFEIKGNKKFILGDDVQNDYIMSRAL